MNRRSISFLQQVKSRPTASRLRLPPSESFRAACGRCIWPRICKSVPCSTPNRLSDINSSEATANRHRSNIITTDSRTGARNLRRAPLKVGFRRDLAVRHGIGEGWQSTHSRRSMLGALRPGRWRPVIAVCRQRQHPTHIDANTMLLLALVDACYITRVEQLYVDTAFSRSERGSASSMRQGAWPAKIRSPLNHQVGQRGGREETRCWLGCAI